MGFRPVEQYTAIENKVRHCDIVSAAQNLNETVIGYRIFEGSSPNIVINPNKNDRFIFSREDQLIVLAQQLYT